ncbi:MAG: hypothetical protein HKP27_00790, partial [Myxococcales bacterium]|nr:hypothetical protein [Myxococcales bacterium]
MIGSLSQQLFETFFAGQADAPAPEAGDETPPGQFLAALLAAAPEAPERQELAPRFAGEARPAEG